MYKIWYRDSRVGTLTDKIAGDCLVLLGMVAQVRYGGEHVELDLICNGKSGLVEPGGHCKECSPEDRGKRGDPGI